MEKKVLDNKGYVGAIVMDLSKTFDTISHDLSNAINFSKSKYHERLVIKLNHPKKSPKT